METGLLFESTDLIREVATFLVDDATTVLRLTCVSKTCQGAILGSPEIWKATCYRRWKSKWGFGTRWKKALLQEESSGTWWRNAYTWQEVDARRTSITAAELHSMTFDFRFWLSQYFGQGNLLTSGLRWTASQEFQFASRQVLSSSSSSLTTTTTTTTTMHDTNNSNPTFLWPGQESGILKGHPSGRDDLEWFLHLDGETMQWGELPNLWPRGTVHRLETWGWEIRNPNVCLRAMDFQEVVNDQGETIQELVKSEDLWKDYFASMRRYPTDFGLVNEGIAFLEAPEEFWEFLQNRTRFPRLGIDEERE